MSTHDIPFLYKKEITLNYLKSAAIGFCPRDSTAVVNEPLVFEPLNVYYIFIPSHELHIVASHSNCLIEDKMIYQKIEKMLPINTKFPLLSGAIVYHERRN